MTTQPYFMSDKNWYDFDDDGNVILRKGAPEKAVADYNRLRKEYLEAAKRLKTVEEMISFFASEPATLKFPLDEKKESEIMVKFNT